jgi:hypothetical protein
MSAARRDRRTGGKVQRQAPNRPMRVRGFQKSAKTANSVQIVSDVLFSPMRSGRWRPTLDKHDV